MQLKGMGFLFVVVFFGHFLAGDILVSQPGIEPQAMAGEAPSLTHWTAKEFPIPCFAHQCDVCIKMTWLMVILGGRDYRNP